MLNKKQYISIVILFSFFVFPFSVLAVANSTGYAWGENIGWTNFNSTFGGAAVSNNGVTGYIWLENIGWVHLDYDDVAGAVNTNSTNWGVTNDGAGNLSGYAWSENAGWINFHPTHSQVTISAGKFAGYAWSENMGWIRFDHSQISDRPETTWSGTTYYSTGYLYSTNLLSAESVNSVDKFGYNCTIPANTTLKVEFSQDGSTWYSASHVLNTWTDLSAGDHLAVGDSIALSGWSPESNFYYRIEFATADTAVSPALEEINIWYNNGTYATVSTQAATSVTGTTATANGTIVSEGSSDVTERGFQYGVSQTSYLATSESGSFSAESYSLSLTNLYANTLYYVRSFVTNSQGRAYGSWQTFTTPRYYNTSGILDSSNLLSGVGATTINSFWTSAIVPAGTSLVMQFATDEASWLTDSADWYSAAGVLGGTTTVPNGATTTSLSALDWGGTNGGSNFFVKMTFTSDTTATPALEEIMVNYDMPAGSANSIGVKGNMSVKGGMKIRNTTPGNSCAFAYSPNPSWTKTADTLVRDITGAYNSTIAKDIYCDNSNCILWTDGATAPQTVCITSDSNVYANILWSKTDEAGFYSWADSDFSISGGDIGGTHPTIGVGVTNTAVGTENWLARNYTSTAGAFNAMDVCKLKGVGWRLPTIVEFDSIRDQAKAGVPKTRLSGMSAVAYWSSSEDSATDAYFLYFNTGAALNDVKTTEDYVRCVRGQ